MLEITEPIIIPSQFGDLTIRHIGQLDIEGIAITNQDKFPDIVPIRVHSSCLFSESLRSVNCDCADQLHESIRIILSEGGLIVYLYDEGRGAGLKAKVEAIKLQETRGFNTAAAYTTMGLEPDVREYAIAAEAINRVLGTGREIELLTNNPQKLSGLKKSGLNIVRRRPIVCIRNEVVGKYLKEKAQVLGHLLDE